MKRLLLVAGLSLAGGALAQWSTDQGVTDGRYDNPYGIEQGFSQDSWSDEAAGWTEDAAPSRTWSGSPSPAGDELSGFRSGSQTTPSGFEPRYEDGFGPQSPRPWEDTGYGSPTQAPPRDYRSDGASEAWRDDRRTDPAYRDGMTGADRQGYRFRGDPPLSLGRAGSSHPQGEFRFRPLTGQEQERMGSTSKWRPMDGERGGGDRSNLFESMTPDDRPGGWNQEDWPRR